MSVSEAKENVIGETEMNQATMEITSEAVYPIIATPNRARFKLKNTGILSKDSVISLEINKLGITEFGFLPFGAGIYSCLKSARLSVGGIVVDEITDPAYYKTITHSYNTPDYRNNVDSILLGINTTMQNLAQSIQLGGIGKYVFGNSNPNYVMGNTFLGANSIYNLDKSLKVLASSDPNNISFTIRLSELFNILQNIELPLFLMNKDVIIDLEFKSQLLQAAEGPAQLEYGKILCAPSTTQNATPLIGASVVPEKIVLFQDTIYYTNERMEQLAQSMNAKEGLYLDYTTMIPNIADHTISTSVGAATTLVPVSKTDLIPVANYRIKNMFMAYTSDNLDALGQGTGGTTINGPFLNSNAYLGKYGLYNKFNDPTEVSIRVNDKLIFNEPIKSMTQKAHETAMVYGSKLYLNHGLYSSNGMVKDQTGLFGSSATAFVDSDLNIFPSQTEMALEVDGADTSRMQSCVGALSFLGVNLSQGLGDDNDDVIMVSKPISVRHDEKFDKMNSFTDLKMRYFTEIVQRFGVKDGMVSILRGLPVNVPVR